MRSNIALMNRTYHLGHNRIAYLLGKGDEFVLGGAYRFRDEGNACAGKDVAHGLGRNISILLDIKDDFVESGYVDTIKLYFRGRR